MFKFNFFKKKEQPVSAPEVSPAPQAEAMPEVEKAEAVSEPKIEESRSAEEMEKELDEKIKEVA